MSRLAAALRLPRKPDFLQHIPAIKTQCKQMVTTINGRKQTLHLHAREPEYVLLLLLNLVIHKDGSAEGATANLLHDLVLIHPGFHASPIRNKNNHSKFTAATRL